MADDIGPDEVLDGAAALPLIPEELGVNPLLLATLHAIVFLDSSAEEVVYPAAAEEALEYLATYLQRLEGQQLDRVKEDLACVVEHGRAEGWPKSCCDFLKDFLKDFGIGGQGE